METKKSPKADLESKRGMFLEIGLLLSLAIVIALFSWSQSEKTVDLMASTGEVVEQDVMDVTIQDQKPPEPVKLETQTLSDIIKVVKNDVKIDQQMAVFEDFNMDDLANIQLKTTSKVETAVVDDEIFFAAEENPKFKGGDLEVFRKWVFGEIVYPSMAAENGITGKVTISFTVEKDGSLTQIKVVRGVDRLLDNEALRVISTSPKWTPAKNNGKPVRFNYTMAVSFTL